MPTAPRKPVTIDQAIASAMKTLKAGKPNEARAVLEQVLKQQPKNVSALRALGDLLFSQRQFAASAHAYGRAVQASPKDLQLLLLLGNALQSDGKSGDALKAFSAVIKLNPKHAVAYNNLGNAFLSLKQIDNALRAYQQSLKLDPKQSLANYNLGVMLQKMGKFGPAAEFLQAAVAVDAKHVPAIHNLGVVYHRMRRHKDAEAAFRRVIKLRSNYAPALQSLGALLGETGRLPDALVTLRSADRLAPNNAQTAFLIGSVMRAMGKDDDGIAELSKALKLDPKGVDARIALAGALIQQDKVRDATTVLFTGLTITPNNRALRRAAVSAMRDLSVTGMSPDSRKILLSLLNDPAVSTQELGRVVIGLVRSAPYFKPMLEAAGKGGDILAADLAAARAMMSDAVLLAALPRMVVCDPDVETILTAIRRAFLFRTTAGTYPYTGAEGVNGPFLSAMSRQLFAAEYSFYVQGDEQAIVDTLREQLERTLVSGIFTPAKLEWSLGIYALYAQIGSLKSWENILGTSLASWSKPLANIIREQVFEKERESEISKSIPSITGVSDSTSQDFLRLYDANPYPRWRSLSVPNVESIEGFAQRLRPGAPVPTFPRPTPVLVAGCGTGHHPIQVAMRFPQAQVTALDLSPVALGYGARMAERFNIGSILWRKGDLLELNKTQEQFAVIECGGVLHHVKDPEAAIGVLRDRLLPGGLMKLGVYSTIARKHVNAARQFVKERGFPDTAEGVREARRAILALPENSPEREVLASSDFYSSSGCRFLAYPIQEHTFTLVEIAEMLARLNLRFLSFDLPARTHGRFRAAHPSPQAATDLSVWASFEEIEPLSFRKMYQFWVDAK